MPRRIRPSAILAAIVLVAAVVLLIINPAREEQDISQQRLDTAALALGPDYTISQTFLSRHSDLNSVTITLVRYERAEQPPADARLLLTLERLDQAAAPVTASVAVRGLTHNQQVRFDFPALADSHQATYRMTLQTEQDYGITVWRTLSDAYAEGQCSINGQAQSGDIRFSTAYDYHLRDITRDLAAQINRWLSALPGLALVLGLPGLALAPWLLPRRRLRWPIISGYILTLSLACWPILFLWASVAPVSLGGWHIWLILAAMAGLAGWGWARRRSALRGFPPEAGDGAEAVLAVILVLSAATRLLQVRNLVLPNWVDSVHHSLLTQLLAETGYVPASYQPYMPVDNLHYHFGFHASAAALTWLSPLGSPQAVLLLGQVLSAIAPLALYILTTTLTGKRWAGTGSALVAGLICYMPAYYASWGRYTHLLGLIMLCPAVCSFYELPGRAGEHTFSWRQILLGGVLLAGLALCHYRALIFAALFIAVLILSQLVRQRFTGWKQTLSGAALAVGVGALLAGPWIYRLASLVLPNVGSTYGGWEAIEGYNSFPGNLLQGALNHLLLAASAASVIWAFIRRRWEIVATAIWAGLCLLAANLHLLGLFDFWLLPNSAVVISFWLPVGLLTGWLAADLCDWLPCAAGRASSWLKVRSVDALRWQKYCRLLLAAAMLAAVFWGSWRMVDIINPVTVQVAEDDLAAMRWISENTPSNARFLVNTRAWSGELHVGSDAGWWIPLLTGRSASMPCILHTQGTGTYARTVHDLAALVESSTTLDDLAVMDALVQAGITHVYIGAAGGSLMPAALDASRHFQLIYSYGPTRIYKFVPDAN